MVFSLLTPQHDNPMKNFTLLNKAGLLIALTFCLSSLVAQPDTLDISMQVGDSLLISEGIGACINSDGTYSVDYNLPTGLSFESIEVKENQTYGTINVTFELTAFLSMAPGYYTGQLFYTIFRGGVECLSQTFELEITITPALKPVADFSTNYTTISQGGAVTFSNLSQNAVSEWEWSFGDGGTSSVKEPTHIFLNTGEYTITLIAIGPAGRDTSTKVDYIHVLPKESPGTLKWRFDTEDDIIQTPALGLNGEVFITSQNKRLFSIAGDGSLKWDIEFTGSLGTPVVGPDGSVFVSDIAGSGGNLWAIDSSGNQLWRYGQDAYISEPAIGYDSTLYVTCYDDSLYALDYSGMVKWSSYMEGYSNGQPVIDAEGTVYVLSKTDAANSQLIAYDPNGTKRWGLHLEWANSYECSLSIDNDGTIYVVDFKVYAVSKEGELKWEYPKDSRVVFGNSQVIVLDSMLLFGNQRSNVIIIDKNGNEIDEIQLSAMEFDVYTPTIGNKMDMYLYGKNDTIFSYKESNIINWSFPFIEDTYVNYAESRGSVIDQNGVLYVGYQDGYLYAIQTESDSLADVTWPKQGCNVFNTNRVLYPPPSLFSPPDSAINTDTSMELSWYSVQGANQYTIEFASNPDFTNSFIREITDTTSTFSGLNHGQFYYWRVRTDFETKLSNWSETRSFKTIPEIPLAPELLNPADDASDQLLDLELRWNSAEWAVYYELLVSTGSGFNDTVVYQDSITNTYYTISGLENNTQYYWKVRASNVAGISDWSEIRSFTTIPVVPLAPELLNPADGASDQLLDLELRWNSAEWAVYYELLVSTGSGFNDTIINQDSITNTYYTISGLENNTQYYWRVKASNVAGSSDWSTFWNFITGSPIGIEHPGKPDQYWLRQNYPNPLENTSVIEFNIPKPDHVRLALIDISGKEIVLYNGLLSQGVYQFEVSKNDLHKGLWLYSIRTNEFYKVRKMIVD